MLGWALGNGLVGLGKIYFIKSSTTFYSIVSLVLLFKSGWSFVGLCDSLSAWSGAVAGKQR